MVFQSEFRYAESRATILVMRGIVRNCSKLRENPLALETLSVLYCSIILASTTNTSQV